MSNQRILSLAIRWLILAFAVWVAAEIVGGIYLEGWKSALLVAAILGLLNLYVRPVLTLLTLPFTIVTLGLFLIIVNAILLGLTSWVAGWFDGIHFHVDGFGAAVLGAIIISLVNVVVGIFVRPDSIARDLTGGF
jgi:putative membrane protein